MDGNIINISYNKTNCLPHKQKNLTNSKSYYIFKTTGFIIQNGFGSAGGNSGKTEFKNPKSGSGKQKASDVPSWAKGNRPYKNENGKQFARRLCDEKFGKNKYDTGPTSNFNQIKKWGDRGFE